ncbi:MAG: endonuclease/exonuclease/phosphatase family protein [Bacteroidales bacterium]|nr:endonuclease/exonuclease/phosphatase family protein [Bacteroidales bacterium]
MKKYIVCIFLFLLATVSALAWLQDRQPVAGPEKAEGTRRIVAYNVGVFSKYQTNSMEEVAELMRELGADVIALCELDSCNRRHDSFQLEEFTRILSGEKDSWQYHFGSAMSWAGGAYGIGVANSSDIQDGFEIKLPKGEGHEPRVCVVTETEEYIIAAIHLDHKNEDVRMEQARIVTEQMKSRYRRSRKPVFLCGDFNAVPDSPTLAMLSEDWTVLSETAPTYPADHPRKCIDYILVLKNRAEYEVVKTEVCTELESADVRTVSDHLPVYVDVIIK